MKKILLLALFATVLLIASCNMDADYNGYSLDNKVIKSEIEFAYLMGQMKYLDPGLYARFQYEELELDQEYEQWSFIEGYNDALIGEIKIYVEYTEDYEKCWISWKNSYKGPWDHLMKPEFSSFEANSVLSNTLGMVFE